MLSLSSVAQKNVLGHYKDYFGNNIELNADSTFKYTFHFDLSGSWTKGTWSLKNDTVYFQMIPTYDTISYKNKDGTFADKLILSVDEKPERITVRQNTNGLPELNSDAGLVSGGQNFQGYPRKLFFKNGRLYKIDKGQIVVKKQNALWINKKFVPWYFKDSG